MQTMPGDIQAIIFDCDGTLVDSMPLHYSAWRNTLSRYGFVFTEERFYSFAGQPTWRLVEMLAAEHGATVDVQAVAREKEEDFLQLIHLVKPIDVVVTIARQAHRQKKLAVASGGWRHITRMQLHHAGILELFETIVTAEDTERHKPEPDVFLEAARRLNVPPSACLVYEDADLGIEAARRAGMQWIDVRALGVLPTRQSLAF
ncbi:MAG: HAD family hydrolase [Pirellulaceae bacterium]